MIIAIFRIGDDHFSFYDVAAGTYSPAFEVKDDCPYGNNNYSQLTFAQYFPEEEASTEIVTVTVTNRTSGTGEILHRMDLSDLQAIIEHIYTVNKERLESTGPKQLH